MSSIEVMSIKGIRAFSPDNDEKITFYKPLTLIVGHNGAGKTTIIECLKLASTGDLPPNVRSGQNFIHDPKVAGEAEVKAQVKMRFKSQFRGSFMVIRNFSLSQKKNKLTFKSLDSALSIWNPDINDFNALPQRCSNINQEVPFSMGVNKAILENVIFVHQEESNWPLEDGKAIKQRFDDIFAATRYTKALEEIKKLKNKQQAEAREKRLQLETLRSYRDQATLLKNTMKESEDANRAHNENISVLTHEIKKISSEMEALETELAQIHEKKHKVSSIKAKYDILSERITKMRGEMLAKFSEEDLKVSMCELQSYKAEFTPRLAQQEESTRQIRQYISEVEDELKKIGLAKEGIVKSYGKIIGQAESYKKSAKLLVSIVDEICLEFQMTKPDSMDENINDKDIQSFIDELLGKQSEYTSNINEMKTKLRHDEGSLQETIDKLSAKISGALEVIRLRKQKIHTNSDKADKIQAEISELEAFLSSDAEAKHTILVNELEEAKKSLNILEDEMRTNCHIETIETADKDLRIADSRIQELRAERSKVSTIGESLMRKNIMVEEVEKFKQKEEKFRSLHGSKVAVTLGVVPSSLPADGNKLVSEMKSWISGKESEEDKLCTQHKLLEQILAEAEANLKCRQSSLSQAKGETSSLEHTFEKIELESPPKLEEQINALRLLKKEKSKKVNLMDVYSEIWNTELQHAMSNSSCMSCRRKFESQTDKESYLDKKKAQISELPDEVTKDQEELDGIQAELERLKILGENVQRYHDLKSNIIPQLEKQEQDHAHALMKAKVDLATATKEVEELRTLLKSSRTIFHDLVIPWSQLLNQIAEQEKQIQNQMHEDQDLIMCRSIEQIDCDLTKTEQLRLNAQNVRESAMAKLTKLQEKVSQCRNLVHSLQQNIIASNEKQQRKVSLQSSLESVMEDSEIAATDAAEKSIELKLLESEKATLVSQREKMQLACQESLESSQRKLNILNLSISRVRSIQNQLGEGNPYQAAKEMEKSLSSIDDKKSSLESRLSNLKVELEKNVQDHQETLCFAEQVQELTRLKTLEEELQSTEEEIGSLGVDMSVFKSESKIKTKLASLQEQRSKMQSEADISAGSFAAIGDNLRKAKERLNSPEFIGINDRYISQLTEVQAVEIATSDLEKYHRALEKALLAFHTSKMDDINKTIKELWQKTYRGVDIDYIQIKADTEGVTSRSSYNYRVVMYVGGAELDMRGRCSAGQKVLSCLIIRLALAENFCLNCGVLALDEPTTNLDAENSASLAEALKSLMVARKDFESFQLIVITHDEEFARRLGSREYTEHLWRITKDENQHSRITREPIG